MAERFLGVPYLWGGKIDPGLDCSGLVQVALDGVWHYRVARHRHGGASARQHSASQTPDLSAAIPAFREATSPSRARRNSLLHANAYHMAVAIEPMVDAVERIRGAGSQMTSVRRIEMKVGLLLLCAAHPAASGADDYPSKSIRLPCRLRPAAPSALSPAC